MSYSRLNPVYFWALLEGLSHEIKVCFLDSMNITNPFNFPGEGFQLILSTFLCLILKLKSPSGTSFDLYFAFEEYRANDSNSPAERNISPAASTDKMKT